MPTVYSPPVSTYTALATITLTSTDTEIVFSSIPATYRDLVLVIEGGTNESGAESSIAMRLNADTGSNYSWVYAWGTGSVTASGASADSRIFIGRLPGSSVSTPGNIILQIMDYSATDKHKTSLSRSNNPATLAGMFAGRYASDSAVTSISLSRYDFAGAFKSGSTFSLYGIAS